MIRVPGPGPAAPSQGLPRWAWALIAALVVTTALATTVATFAARGRDILRPAATPTAPQPTLSEGAGSPNPSGTPTTRADGCLGGASDLNQAVLAAQKEAPLTPEGAAAFTATLVRWAYSWPPPEGQKSIAREIFAQDATAAARSSLSSTKSVLGDSEVGVSFNGGRFYLEAFTSKDAVVTWLGSALVVEGKKPGEAWVSATVHLTHVGNEWRYSDLSTTRSIPEMQSIGNLYVGGC